MIALLRILYDRGGGLCHRFLYDRVGGVTGIDVSGVTGIDVRATPVRSYQDLNVQRREERVLSFRSVLTVLVSCVD